jgi:hypothetical protein
LVFCLAFDGDNILPIKQGADGGTGRVARGMDAFN